MILKWSEYIKESNGDISAYDMLEQLVFVFYSSVCRGESGHKSRFRNKFQLFYLSVENLITRFGYHPGHVMGKQQSIVYRNIINRSTQKDLDEIKQLYQLSREITTIDMYDIEDRLLFITELLDLDYNCTIYAYKNITHVQIALEHGMPQGIDDIKKYQKEFNIESDDYVTKDIYERIEKKFKDDYAISLVILEWNRVVFSISKK